MKTVLQLQTDIGETHMVQMSSDMGSHAPIKQKPYRTPFSQRSIVESRCVVFYRRFIDNFATIAWPLTLLTWKDVRFVWSAEAQEAFKELKGRLRPITHPILAHPNFNKPYKLYKDASGF